MVLWLYLLLDIGFCICWGIIEKREKPWSITQQTKWRWFKNSEPIIIINLKMIQVFWYGALGRNGVWSNAVKKTSSDVFRDALLYINILAGVKSLL